LIEHWTILSSHSETSSLISAIWSSPLELLLATSSSYLAIWSLLLAIWSSPLELLLATSSSLLSIWSLLLAIWSSYSFTSSLYLITWVSSLAFLRLFWDRISLIWDSSSWLLSSWRRFGLLVVEKWNKVSEVITPFS